jgi:hypothetical protein
MHVALLSLAVWFALSLVFAAAHCCWIHYTLVARQPMDLGTKVWLGVEQPA